jgi:hypothetical protein
MQEKTSHTPRRWERQPATVPISLVLEADPTHADDSAITVDISVRGACVRTNLALVRGEWVKVFGRGQYPRPIPALVAWVRRDESSHLTLAGLDFY